MSSGPGVPSFRLVFSVGKGSSWHAVQAFSCYQGNEISQLVTGKAKARTQICLLVSFGVLSQAGYWLFFFLWVS